MSFELELERIPSANTKKYLREVISSFENGNLRSAVVMLYSVFMTDLCEKISELSNEYNDVVAKEILEKMNKKEISNYSRESDFIKDIEDRKPEILDITAKATFRNLKDWRNICAHPSLQDESIEPLPSPNRDIVAGLIRGSIDSLFIHSAFLGSKIFSPLLDDLSRVSLSLPSEKAFEEYVEHRYLDRFNPVTYKYILINLFKVVFCIDNDEANKNREINYRLLAAMIKKDSKTAIISIIESKHFKSIKFDNVAVIQVYSWLLRDYPSLYSQTNLFIKEKIEEISRIESYPINYVLNYFIKSQNLKDHLSNIIEDDDVLSKLSSECIIKAKDIKGTYEYCKKAGCLNEFIRLGIEIYSRVGSYNNADSRFSLWIQPYLNYYTIENIWSLVMKAGSNSQCYGRGLARNEHLEVFEKLLSLSESEITKEDFIKQSDYFLYHEI